MFCILVRILITSAEQLKTNKPKRKWKLLSGHSISKYGISYLRIILAVFNKCHLCYYLMKPFNFNKSIAQYYDSGRNI